MTSPTSANAYELMLDTLRQWGLEGLAADVLSLIQEGYTSDVITLRLQDTPAYKARFAGNDARRKAGLPVLSPREYLATEATYRQILESNGMPPGFYDHPNDFAGWIGSDVSPSEINERVGLAVSAADRVDAGTKRAFRDLYGVGSSDLAAYFLDRERALPLVQRQGRAAAIAGAGYNQGVNFDRATAERLATSTLVGTAEIDTAVGSVAEAGQRTTFLGDLYGDQGYDTTTAAEEVFFGDSTARRRRQRLTQQQDADFSQGSGVGRGSLGRDTGLY